MIARFILPWFGGTAAVWTTCMMFFQAALLLGYLYAHLLRQCFSPRRAWLVHVMALLIAVLLTSVVPPENLKPSGGENPTLAIIRLLAVTIGFPFFVLSSTGPLIQAWQAISHKGQSPFRLYALSNLGSMLALLTYPFLFERFFPMARQAKLWTIAFFLFAICCCWCGWQTVKLKSWLQEESFENLDKSSSKLTAPGIARRLLWFVLAMAASIILLSTTNLMCQEVASIPFLWILPLSLYLLSFIICFDRPALYRRRIFLPLLVVGTIVAIGLVHAGVHVGLLLQISGLAAVCFAASMTCHGELERLKPSADHLTGFYLWIAFGGAVGGFFVAVVAPVIFTGFLEFHVGLIICLLVALGAVIWPAPKSGTESGAISGGRINFANRISFANFSMSMGIIVALSCVVVSLKHFLKPSYTSDLVFRGRNEYGLVSVVDEGPYRTIINGRIEHGGQSVELGRELEHTSYYMPGSGVGVAFDSYRAQSDSDLDVAVIGLGAGSMATWLEPGDRIVFYEINPMVKLVAQKYFSFLKDTKGEATVKLGDGRVELQNEAANPEATKYDLIIIDAFSSDSIPIHLLTSECVELYLKRLKPDGILVAHITNRFIDLLPVFLQHADEQKLTPILIDYKSKDNRIKTNWVLLTRNEAVVQSDVVQSLQSQLPEGIRRVRWTDDYSSVAALLNWSAGVDWEKLGFRLFDLPADPQKQVDSGVAQ